MVQRRAISSGWFALVLIAMLSAFLHTVTGAHIHREQQPAASVTARAKTVQPNVDTTTPRILVPLYIYPTSNAWDPLFTAIRNNPSAAFTVIINPDSGPGSSKVPPSDYAAAIKQLRATAAAHQIVQVVGYVATGYGKKSASKVKTDVAKYAAWPDTVKPDGIFFDETSTRSKYLHQYTEYTDLVSSTNWAPAPKTLSTTTSKIESANRPRAPRTGITILNPGTWPDDSNYFSIADQVVVYEDKLSNFNYSEYKQRTASANSGTPFQRSYIFYNLNATTATTEDRQNFTLDSLVKATVQGLNATGGLFITNLDIQSTDVYAHFSSIWQQFVQSVASLSHS